VTSEGSGNRSARSRWPRWALLVVIAAAALAYSNSLSGPFVFDDIHAIVENPHLRGLWPLADALAAPPQSTVAGRPVVSLSLALNYAAGGLDVRGYHLVNVALHVLCGLLLYGIVRRTLLRGPCAAGSGRRAGGFALACALLWAVHPLNTETVNYVVQRTESIMALFYLLTLYCAVRAAASARPATWVLGSIAACAAGMASKETMVTAPFAVLLHDLAYRSESYRRVLARRWPLYVGLGATWGLLATLMLAGPRSHTVGFGLGIGALQYAKSQAVLIVDYLRLAVWPHPLVFDYGYARPLAAGVASPYIAAVLLLLTAAVILFLRRPVVGYPAIWVFLVLAPTTSVVPIVSEVGAERRMYLPLAGLVVLAVSVAYALTRALERRSTSIPAGRAGVAVLAVVTLALIWTTHRRNEDYRDPVRLWRTVVAARPDNPRGYDQLGKAIHEAGGPGKALAYYERALELDPGQSKAQFNLGVALADLGQTDEAVARYRRALALDPRLARAHHNLGSLLANRGELDRAVGHFREATRHAPEWAPAWQHLGRALRLTGRSRAALESLGHAIRLDPENREALEDRAWILATDPDPALRDGAEAVRLSERAVALAGEAGAATLDALAAAYAEAGRFEDAAATIERARVVAATEEMRQRMDRRLELYRSERPYREAGPAGSGR
jgi:tetratricopeptide (TPR) repeat protein